MSDCPICKGKIKPDFYRFHQRSFLDRGYRHNIPLERALSICESCFYITPRQPFYAFDKAPLNESFVTLKEEKHKENTRYEKVIADRVLRTLESNIDEAEIKKIDSVLDLRALSGGALELLQARRIGKNHKGFDFVSKNVNWANLYRRIRLSLWAGLFEEINSSSSLQFSGIDLIFSSRPVLELCSDPALFLERIKKALSPDGLCIFGERDLSGYPENIFLNELFTPWGNSFFTKDNLRALFRERGFEIIGEEKSGSIVYYLVRPKQKTLDGITCTLPQINPYKKYPRFENIKISKIWHGKTGFINEICSIALAKAYKKIGSIWPAKLAAFDRPRPHRRYPSVQQKYLDVIVVSCGRKDDLRTALARFQKYAQSEKRKFRYIIHDDLMEGREEESRDCRRFIDKIGIFSKKIYADRNMGIGESIKALLKEVETDYYFHLEEDHFFLRPVNVDSLVEIFNRYRKVNYIRLNRQPTTPGLHEVTKSLGDVRSRQYLFNGQILTLSPFWSHSTNIARTDSPFSRLVLNLSGRFRERMESVFLFRDCVNHEDVYEKMGTFVYGPLYQARMVYHSHDVSMRELMLKFFPDRLGATVDDFKIKENI